MKLPSSCFGVLNLRQGSFAIGVVQLVLNCISVLGCIVVWVVLSQLHGQQTVAVPPVSSVNIEQPDSSVITETGPVSSHRESQTVIFPLTFGPALLLTLVHTLFSVLLIVGARREQPRLLLAWLVFQGIVIVLSVVAALVTFVLALRMSEYVLLAAVFGLLGGTVLLAYCFVVVLAYWRELTRAPTHTVVVRQPDMVKMVDIA